MSSTSISSRSKIQRIGLTFCVVNQLFDIFDGQTWMHHQHVGNLGDPCHGCKTFDRVIGQIGVNGRRHGQGANVPHEDGVPVGCCFGHFVCPNGATSAWDIIDDHALPPRLGQLLSYGAGQDVGAASWGERHDHMNRFARISWCLGPTSHADAKEHVQKAKNFQRAD